MPSAADEVIYQAIYQPLYEGKHALCIYKHEFMQLEESYL